MHHQVLSPGNFMGILVLIFISTLVLSSHGMKTANKLLLNRVERLNNERVVILGSSSPRRKEILADVLGFKGFQMLKPSFEENLSKEGVAPADYTLRTAMGKAQALIADLADSEEGKRRILICSDTTVDLSGTVLEKPSDTHHAEEMLMNLQGRTHAVHTGVVIAGEDEEKTGLKVVASFVETTQVRFSPLHAEDVKAYIATGESMDKAGAYGIQGHGAQLVEAIDGDFFTVMGLPAHKLSSTLAELWEKSLI